ncbi:MAG: helix-turn-helix transcriptional regulator [Clostridiales bacterium]|nr:helix-turn-helix transcriptional regulator [Clostridiales bacterium]
MHEFLKSFQSLIDDIDKSILKSDDIDLTLADTASRFGYSSYHFSRKFKEISGMHFRDYVRYRRLAFAFKEVRDTKRELIDIAYEVGYSSHEAFSRAFKRAYGKTPSEYRLNPTPIRLRTIIRPFDCYLLQYGGFQMDSKDRCVKTYFVTIPKHKFLHIKNRSSIGYWDFWQKMSEIPGCDCETICGVLESIKGKLDDRGGSDNNSGAGQLMAFINDPAGRICSWGIPLSESYGVRLPENYSGEIPMHMQIMDVPKGDYIVFEHGPFDFETENAAVEAAIEKAMREFDYSKTDYELDTTEGRVFYFFHDQERYWKYVRPVKRKAAANHN